MTNKSKVDWDDLFATTPPVAIRFSDLPSPEVPNGFFTLTLPLGGHRTFRVRTEKRGALRGTRTVAMLVGSSNETDYETFGHLTRIGVDVWKRYGKTKHAEYAGLLWLLWHGTAVDGYELETSRRCFLCNHLLTDPESVRTGIGPGCRKKELDGNRNDRIP